MTVSTPQTAAPSRLLFKKPRYAIRVALALLSVAIVIVIISATHPVGPDDLGVLIAPPP
jgi:hypothetical protein